MRLQEIDAPEKVNHLEESQTISFTACFQIKCDVVSSGYERYQRILATVYLQEQSIQLRNGENGMAWVYPQYAKNQSTSRHKILPNNKNRFMARSLTLPPLMNGANRTKQVNMEVNMAFDYQSFKMNFLILNRQMP